MTENISINFLKNNEKSVFYDRAFLYGESIYDVIPFYNKTIFKPQDHYERFKRDAQFFRIRFELSYNHFYSYLLEAIDKEDYTSGAIYIQLTGGNNNKRCAMPMDENPNLILMPINHPRPSIEKISTGIKITLFNEMRGSYCFIKSNNRLPNRLAMLHAKENGAFESLWYNTDTKKINESCTSNIFFIQDEKIITPSLSHYIFPGLTRERVIDIADKNNIECIIRDVYVDELENFDGAFLTGSIKQLLPINSIDKISYKISNIWEKLFNLYNAIIDDWIEKHDKK